MDLKNKVLIFLENKKGIYISGEKISEELNVTRAAVWKAIGNLRREGYIIESVTKHGYKLMEVPDKLIPAEIKKYIKAQYIGNNLICFETLDSTNTKAKELAENGVPHGTLIISEEQTGGRGRYGRNWSSPSGQGIWMSVVLRPEAEPANVARLTIIAAAAVHAALSVNGIKADIKWPNDIILNGKKICGILTEMNCELNRINYVVVGIGINMLTKTDEFPEELKEKAASVVSETGIVIQRNKFIGDIINSFEEMYDEFIITGGAERAIEVCRNNSAVIGKMIYIIHRESKRRVKALDIDENGLLVVEDEKGSRESIIFGEVSIRGMEAYI